MGIDFKQLNSLIATYYNEGEFVSTDTDTKLKNAMSSLFDEMDNGGVKDGKLSKDDGLTSAYESLFGITDSKSLTKQEFLGQIDTYVNKLGNERATLDNNYRNSDFKAPLSQEEAYNYGKDVFKMIDGESMDDDYSIVNQYLKKINKNTVLKFLEGYYDTKKANGNIIYDHFDDEGIIEHLDDEYDNGEIEMSSKKNIIISLMELAEQEGLTESTNYLKIKNILDKPDYASTSTNTTFNHNRRVSWKNAIGGGGILAAIGAWAATGTAVGGPLGAVVGGVIGAASAYYNATTDNEILDRAIQGLYDEIKAKQA